MATNTYEELHAKVLELQKQGRLDKTLTAEEKIDFAYGNTKIENDSVTRAMVEKAYDTRHPGR
jgi:hypothetical protein